jgi:hypothetical protein
MWYVEDGVTWITEDNFEPYVEPLYNGKVVCVDPTKYLSIYTKGKIYQFKDGMLTGDNGRKYPQTEEIHNFEDWAKWTGSKFIEVKE